LEEFNEKKLVKNYVDNETFLQLLKNCESKYNISEELGKVFMLIAKNVAFSKQFINYSDSWKSEMISDALYNCCRYVKTFNPAKGDNPFAYFTGVIRNAFIMRIKMEKFKNVKDDLIRGEVYNEFLQDYRLNSGISIEKTEDCEYLERIDNKEEI